MAFWRGTRNRDIVKRAQKELEAFTFEMAETAEGRVTFRWSDGVECSLPAHKTISEARCSCAAVGLCRQLVRPVLAYRQLAESSAWPQAWDPAR